MKTAVVASILLVVLLANMSYCYSNKVDELLKSLNKPPLKSIKSPDGDTIDCVHISQQPALDHPSLKNHSIQMRPSYIPEGLANEKESSIKQMWHLNGSCPEETVPIRRTKREDILRASTVSTFGKKSHGSREFSKPTGHEHAAAEVQGGPYYGTKVTINLWNPKVQQPNEFSLSQLWVVGSSNSETNTIEVGWQICQQLYGDTNTRLFIYWTADNYQTTGCYNACPGFVQTNNQIALGGTISPVSQYDGAQYAITFHVWKDSQQASWWLKVDDTVLGYWPTKLFPILSASSNILQWGGEVVNLETSGQHTTTQMGSGHFPSEGNGKASFIKNIEIVDSSNTLKPAQNLISLTGDTRTSCYNVAIGNTAVEGWGSYFYYGGPGRNSECP